MRVDRAVHPQPAGQGEPEDEEAGSARRGTSLHGAGHAVTAAVGLARMQTVHPTEKGRWWAGGVRQKRILKKDTHNQAHLIDKLYGHNGLRANSARVSE